MYMYLTYVYVSVRVFCVRIFEFLTHAQVVTQLMLDPYYRTCEGLFLLLQKSWFGEATRPILKKYSQLRQSLSKSMAATSNATKLSGKVIGWDSVCVCVFVVCLFSFFV
jgi:hypothetical protein